jgi:NADH dehydrogenase FAD-containing subunit
LIDKKDAFVFLPLLYELSVGNAAAAEVAPKYSTLLRDSGISFIQGAATCRLRRLHRVDCHLLHQRARASAVTADRLMETFLEKENEERAEKEI